MRITFIIALGVVMAVALWITHPSPIPQDPDYHHFADRRPFLGVPNAQNVVSNLPYVLVGCHGMGLLWRQRRRFVPEEWCAFLLLFLGVALTGFGSGYYHLQPDNDRLVWDRLPMTIAFMSLFAETIMERISRKAGVLLLLPLLLLGIGSVVYWYVGEFRGRGDLRFYALAQFYPLAAILLILLLFPARYTRSGHVLIALGWYGAAKVCESLDVLIYGWTGFVSGHTLKHLLAALGAWWILLMVRKRQPI